MECRQFFASFFQIVLWMGAVTTIGGQWIFNVTKQPCEHNGVLEIICCKDNISNIMLEFRYTDGRLVASTDFNSFPYVDKAAFPSYDIVSETSLCATLTASNIVTGTLAFTCTMGNHIMTTNVMATCSNSQAGNLAAHTSNNAEKGYETERNIFLALFCVALVMLVAMIITLAIIKTKCTLKSKANTWV